MKTKNFEKRLRTIAKNIGSFVVFRIGVDEKGHMNILEIENDFDDEEEEEGEIEYPTIIPKIDIKKPKPLTHLEYIG